MHSAKNSSQWVPGSCRSLGHFDGSAPVVPNSCESWVSCTEATVPPAVILPDLKS